MNVVKRRRAQLNRRWKTGGHLGKHAYTWLVLIALTGCTLGPDYQRPHVVVPISWRVNFDKASGLADAGWWERLGDPGLNDMIKIALENNKDLRIATYRVEEFNARLRIAGSASYPQLGYTASGGREQFSEQRAIPLRKDTDRWNGAYELNTTIAWELDIWGRIRRSDEAARAELLSVEDNRRAVVQTVVTDVATGYVKLLSLDKELETSRKTLKSRKESLRLSESRYRDGAISALELAQARSAYEEAAAEIPVKEREIALLENSMSLLLGRNPGPIMRDRSLDTLATPSVPQGIPSDILRRRPDIREAEQNLIAANAQIGIAEAMYFPSVSLTGVYGYASSELNELLEEPSSFGSIGVVAARPIFAWDRISGEIDARKAKQKELVVNYRRTIQTAFREVEDALVSRKKFDEQAAIEKKKVNALKNYAALAQKRYDGGYSSYLEVLDAERRLYNAEIALAQARRDKFVALIDIYRAMGGAWQVVAKKDSANRKTEAMGGAERAASSVKPSDEVQSSATGWP